jgi:type IV secretory pathway VirJ component
VIALTVASAIAAFAIAPAAPRADSIALGVGDLPLTVLRASGPSRVLAVFMSGDGGWAKIDRTISGRLAERGITVIGIDSRTYLSKPRTPDGTARDVARVLRYYLGTDDTTRVALVGYSRGAELVPFVANRLPRDLRRRLALVAMLAPSETASFSFHWTDLVSDGHRPTDLPLAPEIATLQDVRLLCVYGAKERDSLCRSGDPAVLHSVARPGNHHFDRDYDPVADEIISALGSAPRGTPGRGT